MKIGRVIGKGNNQQRFEVKKLLSDKSVFPPLTTAPIDDKAKKDNENLSSMGGVYNMVNLHVYHYAGYSQRSFELYNPIKYVDPDGKFTFQLGTGGTLAGGTAATAEVGICFSYDKDKGVDFGFYSKEGMGSFIGYVNMELIHNYYTYV